MRRQVDTWQEQLTARSMTPIYSAHAFPTILHLNDFRWMHFWDSPQYNQLCAIIPGVASTLTIYRVRQFERVSPA